MILFIDTNVVLDVLLNREFLAESSEKVLNFCSEGGHKAYISSVSFANITYFLYKYRPSEAKSLLKHILNNIGIAETGFKDFENALQSEFSDMEDAYQYYSALRIRGVKYIITRNIKHYKKSSIAVITPEDFIRKET